MIRHVLLTIVATCLRVLPLPSKTGVMRIGRPNCDSPVFLTCNYRLTVERVKQALNGTDCYLLVANSRGLNVWCAATGGMLTNHDVISVLKTSGIEELVQHRRVILPQLAATGVEIAIIQKKSGWKALWGPVDASLNRCDSRSRQSPRVCCVASGRRRERFMGVAVGRRVGV